MIFRLARFRVGAASVDAATTAIEAFARAVGDREPQTLRYDAFREEDGGFVHVMEFADAGAEAAHRGTEHVRRFVDALYPLCDVKPVFTALTPIARAHGPRALRHVETFAAAPEEVYEALMDSSQHAAFTGYAARIEPCVGGRFVTCGERNHGYTLALVPGRKIVQAWRHRDWPPEHHSIATFELASDPAGTRLVFSQEGVPEEAFAWIDSGWRATYWDALRAWLASNRRTTSPR